MRLDSTKTKIAAAFALALLWAVPALAQNAPEKVNQPWFMLGRLTSSVSVTGSSAATALPTAGQTLWLYNTGANDAYYSLGASNAATTSSTTGDYLKAGTCTAVDLYPVGANGRYTYVATISASGTTVTVETGMGQPPTCGGGSGGGGGSVTQGTVPWVDNVAQVAGVALGAPSAYGTPPGAVEVQGVNAFVTNLAAGTAGSPGGGVQSVQGVSSMTPFLVNPGTAANWGVAATGATAPANAQLSGCLAINAEPAAASNGQMVARDCGLSGKAIVLPYTNKENALRGAGSSSSTGTTITLLPASGTSGQYEYLTDLECSNTSATNVYVTLNDINTSGSAVSSVIVVPSTYGGNNKSFEVPLRGPNNGALTATLSANASTIYCNGQGYSGS